MTGTNMTEKDKGKVLAYIKYMSAEQVARVMKRDATTIRRFLAKYRRTKKITNLRRSGRPRALDKQKKKALLKAAMRERRKPLRALVNDLELGCSLRTATRALQSFGVRSRIAAVKPFLEERHIKERFEWCQKMRSMSAYDWWHVIFSDETSVEIGKQSRQIKVWRHEGERYKAECLRPSFSSGRRSVMVWGCFFGQMKGPLVFFDEYRGPKEKITKKIYQKVLQDHLVPFYNAVRPMLGENAVFQQDNAPVHRVAKWLKQQKIRKMDWPSRSPDLNPIENIWKIMKDNIQKRQDFPRNVNDLKTALKEEWSKLDTSVLRRVVDSMPRRIEAVLNANGGSTKY